MLLPSTALPAAYPAQAGTAYYLLSIRDANAFGKWLISNDFVSGITKLFSDPSDYIVSMRVYPFTPQYDLSDTKQTVHVGNVSNEAISGYLFKPTGTELTFDVPFNPIVNGGSVLVTPPHTDSAQSGADYRNYQPYTTLQFWIPYVGLADVDPALCWYKTVKLRYQVDYSTGDSVYMLYTGEDNDITIITTGPVKLGINVPMGANNAAQAAFNTTLSGLTAVISTVAGYAAGGVGGAAMAAVGGLTSTINAARVSGSAGTCSGGVGDLYSPYYLTAVITTHRAEIPTGYAHQYGRPLMQTRTVGDMRGFTRFDDVHPDGVPCTASELDQIVNALRDGIII